MKSAPQRRRRSLLYTPGDRADRFEAAIKEGKADLVVADLEDAVAPAAKPAARKNVAKVLAATAKAKTERGVRINAWPSAEAEADLAGIVAAGPDLVIVPKVEDVAHLNALDRALLALEEKAGLDGRAIGLVIILETARGILRAADLCSATPRIVAACFGAEDLAADAGLRRTPSNAEVAVPRAFVALAAAAAGIQAFDMITPDPKDGERCAREAHEARGLGYTGKMCIHPLQAQAIHDGMRPTPDEVAWAKRIVTAVAASKIQSGGVVVVDGKMVDVPVIRQAERILAQV